MASPGSLLQISGVAVFSMLNRDQKKAIINNLSLQDKQMIFDELEIQLEGPEVFSSGVIGIHACTALERINVGKYWYYRQAPTIDFTEPRIGQEVHLTLYNASSSKIRIQFSKLLYTFDIESAGVFWSCCLGRGDEFRVDIKYNGNHWDSI